MSRWPFAHVARILHGSTGLETDIEDPGFECWGGLAGFAETVSQTGS